MFASHQKLAEALAEAAKKTSAPAVATATASSDGRARMDAKERTRTTATPAAAPVALVNAPWMAPPMQPAAASRPRAAQKPVVATKPVECVPPEALACFPPAGAAPAAAPETAVVEAGTAVAAPAPGQVVKAAEDKPAIGPVPEKAKDAGE
jgi:translation initiation factor IF-3